jgi:hypothetical protein
MQMPRIYDLTAGARRTSELEEAGRALEFVYLSEIPVEWRRPLASLPFLGKGRRGRFSNLLLRVQRGEKLAVFDYGYGRGSGRHAETVAALESPGLALPRFALRPERTIERLLPILGRHDIDFASFPAFSRRYYLRGDDEAAVRALFTSERLQALEEGEPCALAGAGTRLIYFEPDHLIWPGALDAFVKRAGAVFARFRG